MKKKNVIWLLVLLMLTNQHVLGQITEDFSDGDFTDGNPLAWTASTTSGSNDFVVTSEEVQSSGPASSGDIYLSTDLGIDFTSNDVEWLFKVRYTGGSPSSANYVRIFLMSDVSDFSGSPTGYYIRLGESGSSDGIDLYKTSSSTPIILDNNDLIATTLDANIRVTRYSSGAWFLEADNTGGSMLTAIGSVMDADFDSGSYFGMRVNHSSTRNQDYYLDDVIITITPVADTNPPFIQSIVAISTTEVDVLFNENVDQSTAEVGANYSIDQGVTVTGASLDESNGALVHLTVNPLINGTTYTVTINNVEDLSGNAIEADSQGIFEYLVFEEPMEFDVVINEFMADPNPVQMLPDAEFVELYNRSTNYFNLESWTLDGQTLPSYTLAPDSYAIVVEDDDYELFEAYGGVISIETLTLSNTASDEIVLADDHANTIHQIAYEGSTGGFSAELINPNGPDYSSQNFGISTDSDGGTPGRQNAIFDDTPDASSPDIVAISVISNTKLDVFFSEFVEETSAERTGNYSIDGGIAIEAVFRDDTDETLVHLTVSPLVSGEVRTLLVDGVEDISGNVTVNETVQFEYIETEEAIAGDVVINEFLALPSSTSGMPNAEFIELYNASSKFIDLSGWTLQDAVSTSSTFSSTIIRPDEYLILTETDNGLQFEVYGDVLEVGSFVSLNNSGDRIVLRNAVADTISSISYSSATAGITWEMINPNGPDYSINNYGLSTDAEGGTPGLQNAIFDDTPDTTPPGIESISVISGTELAVYFNEQLNATSAETLSNYSIDGGVNVLSVSIVAIDNALVHLTLSPLSSAEMRTLTVNGVEDISGNATVNETTQFEYIETEEAIPGDVVINEFLALPSSTSAMPNAEFIELYNASSKFIDLSGWTLQDEVSASSSLSAFILRPDNYLILTETGNGSLFERYGHVLEVGRFISLNNGGDSIQIQNGFSQTIAAIYYEDVQPGVSLELVNPNDPCISTQSYASSIDLSGGTPGKLNAVYDDTPDMTPPEVASYDFDFSLHVDFSELVDASSLIYDHFVASNGLSIKEVIAVDGFTSTVEITFNESIVPGITYEIAISGIRDCSGNEINPTTLTLGVGRAPQTHEIIITEIMADETPLVGLPEHEYIEIYNSTSSLISTADMALVDEKDTIDFPPLDLQPDSYYILTSMNGSIAFDNAIGIAGFPSLSNAGEPVTLVVGKEVIFSVDYNITWHDEHKREGGYSLEMINPKAPCLVGFGNWSSSKDESGGSPGYQNSVFDDTPDTTPPSINSHGFDGTLAINFSEIMDASSLQTGTYESESLMIDEVLIVGDYPTSVSLNFVNVDLGIVHEVQVSEVFDCSGNRIDPVTLSFSLGRPPSFNELIISEIMYDAEPTVGLPEREFIEVHNASEAVISTEGVFFSDATDTTHLPAFNINPGSYRILTSSVAAAEFEGAIGVAGFPTLNNSGEQLVLSYDGAIIFSVSYDPLWHQEDKLEGGYSLEMIDVTNPCVEENNWGSSANSLGGTPGFANSLSGNVPDHFGPRVESIVAISPDTIRIQFDEKLSASVASEASITVQPTVPIAGYVYELKKPNSLLVLMREGLEESTEYEISIQNVVDCSGNRHEETNRTLVLPSVAVKGEIKLSEVLFNPRTNGVDFVEVYNDSEHYLSLNNWQLARITNEGLSDNKTLTNEVLVIDPHAYMVFTPDPGLLLTNYPKGRFDQFIKSSLPTYANDTGHVVLLNDHGIIQEQFYYDEAYHYDLLESLDGVSLERISFTGSTNDANNWRSASSTQGFATPGYANSQSSFQPTSRTRLSIEPKVFVPGNTGSGRDFTLINYQFENAGQFANVSIYDQKGRLIKHLAQGALLSTSGFFRWDGVTNTGTMARMGYYAIVFEIYDGSGNTEVVKETVVVGRNF